MLSRLRFQKGQTAAAGLFKWMVVQRRPQVFPVWSGVGEGLQETPSITNNKVYTQSLVSSYRGSTVEKHANAQRSCRNRPAT